MWQLLFLLAAWPLPAAMAVYKDSTARFTVDYPATWQKQELPNIGGVAFLRPKSSEDYFQENVNIVKQDISLQPITQQQLNDVLRAQAKAMQGFNKIISEKSVTIAGQSASEMVYNVDMNPLKIKISQSCFIKGKIAFIITYTGTEDKFETYQPQAKAIIGSMNFY